MDLLKLATELFMSNSSSNGMDSNIVMKGLKGLLADESGNIDLSGLISKFGNIGLTTMVSSWLGDGSNEALSTEQITETLGQDKVSSFATSLGMNSDSAISGLAAMIPQLIDKSSNGGSLLSGDNLGKVMDGLGGLFK